MFGALSRDAARGRGGLSTSFAGECCSQNSRFQKERQAWHESYHECFKITVKSANKIKAVLTGGEGVDLSDVVIWFQREVA